MKKTLLSLAVATVALAASAAAPQLAVKSAKLAPQQLTEQKVKKSAQQRLVKSGEIQLKQIAKADSRATGVDALAGTWAFVFGDYYFEESINGPVAAVFDASVNSTTIMFQPTAEYASYFLPFGAVYSEDNSMLVFPRASIGTSQQGYYIFQEPFQWNSSTYDLDDIDYLPGTYDSVTGNVSFPSDCGLIWGAYYDQNGNNFAGYFDILDFISAEGPAMVSDDDWEDVGEATLVDGWVLPVLGIDQNQAENQYKVPLQQSTIQPGVYRLVDPYHVGPAAEFNESSKVGYITFDVSNPNIVVFKKSAAGFANSQIGSNGIKEIYCYNTIAVLKGIVPDYSYEEIASIFGEDFPITKFKDGVVELSPITDTEGETIFDANFGHDLDPSGGYWWTLTDGSNPDMSAKIIFPQSALENIFQDFSDAAPVYYNLQGIQIKNPEKGSVVIVKKGGEAKKVIF